MSLSNVFQGWLNIPSGVTESIALRDFLKQFQLRVHEAFRRLTIDNLEATLAETSLYPIAWGSFNGTATGTNPITIGKGLVQVQRTGTGVYVVTLNQTLENNTFAVFCSVGTVARAASVTSKTTTSFTVSSFNTTSGAATDVANISVVVYPNRG